MRGVVLHVPGQPTKHPPGFDGAGVVHRVRFVAKPGVFGDVLHVLENLGGEHRCNPINKYCPTLRVYTHATDDRVAEEMESRFEDDFALLGWREIVGYDARRNYEQAFDAVRPVGEPEQKR